jgi:hypothetical protein
MHQGESDSGIGWSHGFQFPFHKKFGVYWNQWNLVVSVFVSAEGRKFSLKFLKKLQDLEKYFVMYLNVCVLLEYLNFLTETQLFQCLHWTSVNFYEILSEVKGKMYFFKMEEKYISFYIWLKTMCMRRVIPCKTLNIFITLVKWLSQMAWFCRGEEWKRPC